MTRHAFEKCNGGYYGNGRFNKCVLHLIAIAHAVDVSLTLEEFQKVSIKSHC